MVNNKRAKLELRLNNGIFGTLKIWNTRNQWGTPQDIYSRYFTL